MKWLLRNALIVKDLGWITHNSLSACLGGTEEQDKVETDFTLEADPADH